MLQAQEDMAWRTEVFGEFVLEVSLDEACIDLVLDEEVV